MLYLDDLNIGDRFKSRSYLMSEEEVLAFAHQYDPQSFHTDADGAQQHPIFRGIAASGWHTAAVTMRLWTECFTVAYGLIGSESHVRWPRPTRINDLLYVVITIKEIHYSRSKPDRGIVSYETHTFNQKDEIVFQSMTKILVFTKQYQTS